MTDRELLAELEREYPKQPRIAQQADFVRIRELRHLLGLEPPSHSLLMGAAPNPTRLPPTSKAAPEPDLVLAAEVYAKYLEKRALMKPHREYADRIGRATHGPSMTPVYPMACMGTGGGPLRCDVCGKPMVLEGGKYNNVPADKAWARVRLPQPNWLSYIRGGMVVDVVCNGTLRIYHGHIGYGPDTECSKRGDRALAASEALHKTERPAGLLDALDAYLKREQPALPDRERLRLVSDVVNEVYGFDPGIGVNRPD